MNEIQIEESHPLGKTDLAIPPLGIGVWAWGERYYWGYGKSYGKADIQSAFEACMDAGINFFDTAEIYGRGNSERLLGNFLREKNQPAIIATKFMPFPWRIRKSQMQSALQGSLNRLGISKVDLYQIHWPASIVSVRTWSDGLADLVEKGFSQTVGVSNFRLSQIRRSYIALKQRGVMLASNQVEFNLLNRNIEQNGILAFCQEFGVTILAYSPLAQGLLTGKYSPKSPPSGIRALRYRAELLNRISPLLRLMTEIGRENGKTVAQVAINWAICKGTVPLVGVKTARQVRENIGALGWRLSPSQVAALDKTSLDIQP
ncbi:MAG: aldo/keto reductase [Anaerolineales bacterium]|nr:aldo/keto reductase [Anaerolineales bacterium]